MAKNRKQAAKGANQRGAGELPSLFNDLKANKAFHQKSREYQSSLPEDLFEYGFGDNYGFRKPQRYEIDLCIAWIEEWTVPRKTINRDYGSYFLKHVVEQWSGECIPNGAFIAAAIEFGCKYIREGPNARFNLSYKLPKKSKNRKASGWSW